MTSRNLSGASAALLAALAFLAFLTTMARPASAAPPIDPGDTRVSASFLAESDLPGSPFAGRTRGISGLTSDPSTTGFQGTNDAPASWSVSSTYSNVPSPTLSLSASVSGTVFEGYSLQAGGYGQAAMNYRINCSPMPQCLGTATTISIKGSVSTSVSLTLASGQAAPTQAAQAYALVEIGTDANIRPTILLGNDNLLPPQYNVFLSSGYHVEGFSPSTTNHTGIDISADVDALDTSLSQLGILTGQQSLTGNLTAAPAKTSFVIQASAMAGTLYSVFMRGEIGVLSTRLGDAASISLLIDPVISIDPAFQLAHPETQFSIEVGPGVGNVAAVPEPESWAMLIAGLCLVGGLAQRRRPS